MVIGQSGGKDSALAFLVAVAAFEMMGLPLRNIHAFSLPGPGTSDATRVLSRRLSSAVSFEEVSIRLGVEQMLADMLHDGKTQDVPFENAQARYRTYFLMQKANQLRGLVIGTGDLSEIANGYSTFNGDHISNYNPNCGVPKGLVKYVLGYVAKSLSMPAASLEEVKIMREALMGILSHPDSAELTSTGSGEISQITEDKVGPYELAEFFLYEFVRWGSEPRKILLLAQKGFAGKYDHVTIKKWLRSFYIRFFGNQWKRSVATDGPQVGSVSLSPRGKWRMPSDAEVTMWLKELDRP